MTRLLCLLLGHVRWQRDGRFRGMHAPAIANDPRFLHDPHLRVTPSLKLHGPGVIIEAQHYLPFSRSWLCFRCHRWQDEPHARVRPAGVDAATEIRRLQEQERYCDGFHYPPRST